MSQDSRPYPLMDLRPLLVGPARATELKLLARDLVSLDLSEHQTTDIEMLGCGAYTPLEGYMDRAEYASVQEHMRLSNGQFWPLPLALEVSAQQAAQLLPRTMIALRDGEGFLLAVLHLATLWQDTEARNFLAGKVEVVALPQHHDFLTLRLTPQEVRARWRPRAEERLWVFLGTDVISPEACTALRSAVCERDARFLWLCLGGELPGNEAAYFARVRAQKAQALETFSDGAAFSLINLTTPTHDMRAALFLALVARNFGASDVMLEDISLAALAPFQEFAGVNLHVIPQSSSYRTALFAALDSGAELPHEMASALAVKHLRDVYPRRSERGYCIFFTGLSGAGKSTLAKALMAHLLESGTRQVTLLDGDIVRKNLSSELGFSRAHRNLNVQRIAYVASEIVKHRGIAICAPIAPYQAMRESAREMIEQYGGFFEIYVATPLDVCEARDRKGLYAKARAGLVKEFTGISDPYEAPSNPAISIDASTISVEVAVQKILGTIKAQGYLA